MINIPTFATCVVLPHAAVDATVAPASDGGGRAEGSNLMVGFAIVFISPVEIYFSLFTTLIL